MNDGNIVGQQTTTPEIAALLCTSGQRCNLSRIVITYCILKIVLIPRTKPRFLPLWSPAYESLQCPMLFLNGEAGWSAGHHMEEPPNKSQTMNRTNSSSAPFLFYCRQRLLSEPIFQTNSRIAQEWACDMFSRHKENKLNCVEFISLQQRLATTRPINQASDTERPGKVLPASFHGPPMKRKTDTEDELAIINRRVKLHLLITVTCNPEGPSIVDTLKLEYMTVLTCVAEFQNYSR